MGNKLHESAVVCGKLSAHQKWWLNRNIRAPSYDTEKRLEQLSSLELCLRKSNVLIEPNAGFVARDFPKTPLLYRHFRVTMLQRSLY